MDMDHMLRLLPDIYIMKAFMRTDLPGELARLIAAEYFFRMRASARCFSFRATDDDFVSDVWSRERLVGESFSSAATRRIPRGHGNFVFTSVSLIVRSTDHFLGLSSICDEMIY